MTDKPKQIVFAPGVLEQLEQEMNPEDLQPFLDALKEALDDGSFIDQGEVVDLDQMAIDDPETYAIIKERLNLEDISINQPTLH